MLWYLKAPLFLMIFTVLSFAETVFIVGDNYLGTFSTDTGLTIREDFSVLETLFDKKKCLLWIKKDNQFLRLTDSLEISTTINGHGSFLGDEMLQGYFWTFSDDLWTYRNQNGEPLANIASISQFPSNARGDEQNGFWVLDFNKAENILTLVHYKLDGSIIWSRTVSNDSHLWHKPKLFFDSSRKLLWIAFTVTTSSNIYSPRVEVWSTNGERLYQHEYSHKGVLQDACLTSQGDFLISRDIPSHPYTAPLLSFIDSFNSLFEVTPLYKSPENDLIPSLSCNLDQVWSLHRSLFGGENSHLDLDSTKKKRKLVLSLKAPAWKIHACSLE